jgi:hypothetical protein
MLEAIRSKSGSSVALTMRTAIKAATLAAAEPKSGIAIKATSFDDEAGVIIAKVSVAGVQDREKETAQPIPLREATYELAMKARPVDVDLNHDAVVGCDIVGVWFGDPMPDPNAAYVALRPHDRQVYEDAKNGDIIGMSWSGPYVLSEAT